MAELNIHSRMFKKSNRDSQINLFGGIPALLEGKSKKQFDDASAWHNQFRSQIIFRIDESPYKVLFSERMGAPNAPVSLLLGMMVLKEAMNWSDLQLFEQCRFNLLVRSALGLFNLNDDIPAESTYYLLRKRIHEYYREKGEDLFGITFKQITRDQISEFNVNGKSIRMDSKLIGSNIAFYSRYEIIHRTLVLFCKSMNDSQMNSLSVSDKEQLKQLLEEEPQKTVYRSTGDEVKSRMQQIGVLAYRFIKLFDDTSNNQLQLLRRVFEEQYKVGEEEKIELRPKEEITSSSVQSPHDPDGAYRQKGEQKVKGYSTNVTDMATGQTQIASPVAKRKNSKEDRWYIQTENGKKYFGSNQIRASQLRKKMHERPVEESRKRNNVEATIFHLACTLHNKKTKYRGIFKQQIWANCRGLWINLVRITKFLQQTCQRTFQTLKNQVNSHCFRPIFAAMKFFSLNIDLKLVMYVFLFVFMKFINF